MELTSHSDIRYFHFAHVSSPLMQYHTSYGALAVGSFNHHALVDSSANSTILL